jgi:hypothetical protein
MGIGEKFACLIQTGPLPSQKRLRLVEPVLGDLIAAHIVRDCLARPIPLELFNLAFFGAADVSRARNSRTILAPPRKSAGHFPWPQPSML